MSSTNIGKMPWKQQEVSYNDHMDIQVDARARKKKKQRTPLQAVAPTSSRLSSFIQSSSRKRKASRPFSAAQSQAVIRDDSQTRSTQTLYPSIEKDYPAFSKDLEHRDNPRDSISNFEDTHMEELVSKTNATMAVDQDWIDELESDEFDKTDDEEEGDYWEKEDILPTVDQAIITPATAQVFATGMISMAATENIPFHDLQDSDIESVEEYAAPVSDIEIGDTVKVPLSYVNEELSDFYFALGVWCDKEGISRRSYDALREVLCMLENEEVRKLPRRLGTLLKWCRNRLPLPSIQKKRVTVRPGKQPTKTKRPSRGDVYFFDPRVAVVMQLSTIKAAQIHTGMADIVDSPSELWHTISWGSSIRTCSMEYLRYSDQSPIFPSDFVQYRCALKGCDSSHGLHCGQIFFFGRDQRTKSITKGQELLKIRPALTKKEAQDCFPDMVNLIGWQTNQLWQGSDLVLVEDADMYISPSQVISHRADIFVARGELSPQNRTIVRWIFNKVRRSVRAIELMSPIRGELELQAYGRSYLSKCLKEKVLSFPQVLFIDDFGLYRNMYRSLTGIYALPAGLPMAERQKSINAQTLTLGPHGSDFNDVIMCLDTGIDELERGRIMDINGEQRLVWAPILAFLGDMKQQQSSAGFLGARANSCCRFCDANLQNRGDLQRDTVLHGRYHYQVQEIRSISKGIRSISAQQKYLASCGLAPIPSRLEEITPALDVVMSRPPDPAHSEYYGLVRRLYPLIYSKILYKQAAENFTSAFLQFPFPPGWGRIQSPQTHMKSWSMSECGRASVIIPILLRCWLKPQYIRKPFKDGLELEFPSHNRPCQYSDVDLIVSCFAKIAKTNALISAFTLSAEDRGNFHRLIVDARQCFVGLMNAGAKSSPESRNASRQVSLAPNPVTDADFAHESTRDPDIEISSASRLPNLHIGLHFERIVEEYGVLWNTNVLFGEDKHRFFKQAVLSTNHRKPERQLLVKDAVRGTVKCLLLGAFRHTDVELSIQFDRLRLKCPTLLESLLSTTDRQAGTEDFLDLVSCTSHSKPAVRGKLKRQYARLYNLPSTIKEAADSFVRNMSSAMESYGIRALNWGVKPLHWYEQCSFTSGNPAKRFTFHTGDFVLLETGEYAEVYRIYTHCLSFEEERRVFFWVRLLHPASYRDEVLNLAIYRLTQLERIVSLPNIRAEKAYMVPISRSLNERLHHSIVLTDDPRDNEREKVDFVHCTWNINFL